MKIPYKTDFYYKNESYKTFYRQIIHLYTKPDYLKEANVFNVSKIKPYMLDEITNLMIYYASYTGGIDIELSLTKKEENPPMLKELFGIIKKTIDNKEMDEEEACEYIDRHNNAFMDQGEGGIENPNDIEEDESLNEKYYIINYDEEPFIPQQHYFNSFYMVDQVMFDKEEAEEVLKNSVPMGEDEFNNGYDEDDIDPEDHEEMEGQYH